MLRNWIVAFAILLFMACGISEEERSAREQLLSQSNLVDSILLESPQDISRIDGVSNALSYLQQARADANDIGNMSAEVSDSIDTAYSILESELKNHLTSLRSTLVIHQSDSIMTTYTGINLDSIWAEVADYAGYTPDDDSPSLWTLRNVELEGINAVAQHTDSLWCQMDDAAYSISVLMNYELTPETYVLLDSLSISLDATLGELLEINHFAVDCEDAVASVERHDRFTYLQGRMRIDRDDAVNMTWYYHVNSPRYTNSRNLTCYAYIGRRGLASLGSLKFLVGYTRGDWVFMDEVKFNIDGSMRTLDFDEYDDMDSYISGGNVSEWVNITAPRDLLEEIASGEEVYVNFAGRNRRYSPQLTNSDLVALREVLEFHSLMGEFSDEL